MKGNPKVIDVLNQCLKAELTAINQYFLHAEMCENWGYERLAKLIKKESIEEMVHAEKLMERLLFLDGTPNMSDYFKINIGATVEQQFRNDVELEYDAVKRLNAGVKTCTESRRQRVQNAARANPERRRTPYRLAGSTTPRHDRDGRPELPDRAVEKRRKVMADLVPSSP